MILLSLLLAAAAVEDAPTPSEIHNFHDWVVTCDNGLRCQAVSLVPEETRSAEASETQEEDFPWERYAILRLERGPEADAPLDIAVLDFEGTPARLVQYGRPLDGVGFTRIADGEWRVQAADLPELIQRLYSEKMVVQDANGRTIAELAVRGAHGALLYMEERQRRLHTGTSYMRPGNRPASVIPPAPALPVVTVAPRTDERPLAVPAARIAAVRRSNGCLASEIGGPEEQRAFALGSGRTLILLSCGAGAYNYNSVPLIARRDGRDIRIDEARLDVPPQEGVDETQRYYLTNAEWDADRRMIHEYAKGRGLGDCGVRASYAWTGETFRLVEQEEMSECRGTYFYLTTWRTEVR